MSGRLTNAERDAIDDLVRIIVQGQREKPVLVESPGELTYPPPRKGAVGPFWGPAANASYAGHGSIVDIGGDGGGGDGGGGSE